MTDFNLYAVNKYVEVRMVTLKKTPTPAMVHKPTGHIIKTWAMIEGLEQGAWWSMVDYAEAAVKLDAVRWQTTDASELFPLPDFVSKYLDPIGNEEQPLEEVAAWIWEKIIREAV